MIGVCEGCGIIGCLSAEETINYWQCLFEGCRVIGCLSYEDFSHDWLCEGCRDYQCEVV